MSAGNTLGLTPHQYQYAQDIVATTKQMGLTQRDAQIAIMTAITESGLQNYANRNVPDSLRYPHDAVGSDHASLGDFQQQTPGWGSVAELMQPHTDHVKFLTALKSKRDRYSIQPWQAAQEVQNSAYASGSNYQQNWARGKSIASSLWSGTSSGATAMAITAAPAEPPAGGGTPAPKSTVKPPFATGSLTAPLSAAHRVGILSYLENKGYSQDQIVEYIKPWSGGLLGQLPFDFGKYAQSGWGNDTKDIDTMLLTAYNATAAGGGFGHSAPKTEWHASGVLGIGDAIQSLSGVLKGFGTVFDALAWLFHPDHFMRFLLYLLGTGSVAAGLFMLARSTKD